MAKYRVWAESITDVYIDIEADNEDQAYDFAKEYVDGGEWHADGGDWELGSVYEIDEDDDVDYTIDRVREMMEG